MAPHAEHDHNESGAIAANDQIPQAQTNGKSVKSKGKGKSKEDVQSRERIQRLDQLYSKKKRQTHFVPTPTSNAEPGKVDQISHVVLKVRRIICEKGYPSGTEIDIKSELLKDALSEIFEGVEGLQLNETPPVISPEFLFYARQGLHSRVEAEKEKPTPNRTLVNEFGVALEYVSSDYASMIESLSSFAKYDEITFDHLWTLFPPNAKVYTTNNLLRQDQVFKLGQGDYARRQNGSPYYSMKLKQRGQRYLQLLNTPSGTYQEYLGPAVTENREVIVNDQFKKVTLDVSGRIMLDSTTIAQQNKYTDLLKPSVTDEIPGAAMTTSSITDDELLYCNHSIGGFAFRQKK